jgi:hypothetical protein
MLSSSIYYIQCMHTTVVIWNTPWPFVEKSPNSNTSSLSLKVRPVEVMVMFSRPRDVRLILLDHFEAVCIRAWIKGGIKLMSFDGL